MSSGHWDEYQPLKVENCAQEMKPKAVFIIAVSDLYLYSESLQVQ
jgi:hypothetical protein